MSDGEQPGELMRRPRGRARHAAREPVAVARHGWRARLAAVAGLIAASVERRISAAGAWLAERRLRVLIFTISVVTVAMIGGAVALIASTGAPRPVGEAARVLDTHRPTPTDPGASTSHAPILPSPGPPPSTSPTSPAPSPEDQPAHPVPDVPGEPTAEPGSSEPPPPETTPGPTTEPDEPKNPDEPAEDCDEQDGLLVLELVGPSCP